MAAAPFDGMHVLAAEDRDRDGGTACGMAADQLPLRNAGGGHPSVSPLFDADLIGEPNVTHQ